MDSQPTTRARRRRAPLGFWVFLAAVVPHLWTLNLAFANDDYTVIAGARYALSIDDAPTRPFGRRDPPPPAAPAESTAAAADLNYLFRPVAAAWWTSSLAIGGGEARGVVFRIANLLAHGLNAWLLYRVFRRFAPDGAAALAAGLFGCAAAAHQAITWIAAAGDLLSTTSALGGLAVLLATVRSPGAAGFLGVVCGGALIGAAFGAKESSPPLMFVAAIAYAGIGRPTLKRFVLTLIVAGLVAAAILAWRRAFLGYWIPRYPASRPFDLGVIERLPALLGQMAVPYNRAPAFVGMEPWIVGLAGGAGDGGAVEKARLVAACCFAPALFGALFGGFRNFRFAAAAAVAAAALLAPASWMTFQDGGDYVYSRNVYHGAAGIAAVLCAGLAGWSRLKAGPLVAVVAAPLFIVAADGLIHAARVETRAASMIRTRLDGIAAIVDAEPPNTRVVAIDPEDGVPDAGVPLVGVGYAAAFSAPFRRREAPVERWYAFDEELLREIASEEPRRTVFARVENGVFVRTGPTLPASTGPAEFAAVADVASAFAPLAPTPARFIAAFRVKCRATGGATGAIWTIQSPAGNAPEHVSGALFIPENGEAAIAPSPAIAPDALLVDVRFVGVEAEGPIEAMAAAPKIDVVEGVGRGNNGRLEAGRAPSLALFAPPPAPEYRMTFRFELGDSTPTIVYVVRPDRLIADGDGVVRWSATSADEVIAPAEFGAFGRFEDMAPLWEAKARPAGITAILVRYRVEGYGAGAPISRSPWGLFRLVGPLQ